MGFLKRFERRRSPERDEERKAKVLSEIQETRQSLERQTMEKEEYDRQLEEKRAEGKNVSEMSPEQRSALERLRANTEKEIAQLEKEARDLGLDPESIEPEIPENE